MRLFTAISLGAEAKDTIMQVVTTLKDNSKRGSFTLRDNLHLTLVFIGETNRAEFRHAEGNSCAHLKASCIGSSVTVIIENSAPLLGRWQGIYFCEFDGPRTRKYYIKVVE